MSPVKSKYCLVFLLSCGGFLLLSNALGGKDFVTKYIELQKSRDILSTTVSKLDQETKLLVEEINKIKNSKSYVHKVLRDRYHLIGEDEEIMFFAD